MISYAISIQCQTSRLLYELTKYLLYYLNLTNNTILTAGWTLWRFLKIEQWCIMFKPNCLNNCLKIFFFFLSFLNESWATRGISYLLWHHKFNFLIRLRRAFIYTTLSYFDLKICINITSHEECLELGIVINMIMYWSDRDNDW